ncbi:hypothetical protein [Citricoccus nitrophenolicus]|uniref:hypothetical protein n=1 Tax=Citricoccus nitrophenolicus TaxID=863575 RepID=UPI0031EC5BF7
MMLSAGHGQQIGDSLSLSIYSPCLEMPKGRTKNRSGLGSMYGSSDPMYPYDDRWKFADGEPKP